MPAMLILAVAVMGLVLVVLAVGWRPESGVKGTGAVPVHGDVKR
jgi:hypothetical protein